MNPLCLISFNFQSFHSKDTSASVHYRGSTDKQVNGLLKVRSTWECRSTLNLGICLQITPSVIIQDTTAVRTTTTTTKRNYVRPRSGSYSLPMQVCMETPSTSPASTPCKEINKDLESSLSHSGSKSSCFHLLFTLCLLCYFYLIDNQIIILHLPFFEQAHRIHHFDWVPPGCWAWCAWSAKTDVGPALVEISVKWENQRLNNQLGWCKAVLGQIPLRPRFPRTDIGGESHERRLWPSLEK